MKTNLMNKLNNKKSGKKGFTLMEMLIVVAIIAILVAIAIPTMTSSLTKAKIATDEANLRAYYSDVMVDVMLEEGSYPDAGALESFEIDGVTYTLKAGTATVVKTDDSFYITYTPESGEAVNIPGATTQG
jgi:prepilin-type N-terminal cleavage/methylation domain-containing protein